MNEIPTSLTVSFKTTDCDVVADISIFDLIPIEKFVHVNCYSSCLYLYEFARIYSNQSLSKVASEDTPVYSDSVEFKEWQEYDGIIQHVNNIVFNKVNWTKVVCSNNGECTPCWGLGIFLYDFIETMPVENGQVVERKEKHRITDLKNFFKNNHPMFKITFEPIEKNSIINSCYF